MAHVTVKASSESSVYFFTSNLISCSDDVIEAAWDNTLGVHALVWVRFSDLLACM